MIHSARPAPARRLAAILLGGVVLAPPAPALARELPARMEVGTNADGDTCVATRTWEGGSVRIAANQPFTITCRGSTQTRGYVARVTETRDTCGEAREMEMAGLGRVRVARCRDSRIGQLVVTIQAADWRGAALESAIAPTVTALRAVRAGAVQAAAPVTLALADLPPAPAGVVTPAATRQTGIDAAAAVQYGLAYIYAGANVEASRLLNDGIAQFAGAPLSDRVGLRLNAALADSNIGEFAAADAHFAEADKLLGDGAALPEFREQAAIYRSLHLINQGRWRDSLAALPSAVQGAASLRDPATLAALNRPPAAAVAGTIDTARGANTMILAAQEEIVRSTAHLRLSELSQAQAALRRAMDQEERISGALTPAGAQPRSLPWLRARLERQRGRIAMANGDVNTALGAFDCAIATMQDVAPPPGTQCFFPTRAVRVGPQLGGPVIAEAQLERAAALERIPGVPRAQVLADYQAAVDTLASSSASAAATSSLLGRYLDLLVQESATDGTAGERYFRALQTVRESGIAREFATLQSVVSAGPLGGLRRDSIDLERRSNQLRAEIGTLPADSLRLATAQRERDTADAQLEAVKQKLRENSSTAAIDDEPVTVAALQRTLRSGEAYLKLVPVGPRVYGVVVTPQQSVIYVAKGSAAAIARAADAVLGTARSRVGEDGRVRIRPFASDKAHDLFTTVAGPAAPLIASARSLVVDTGTTLGGLPAAVLVTRPAPPRERGQNDYSGVSFLAKSAELASALSPRTFMRARTALAPSAAARTLIGFGQNAPAPVPAADTAARAPLLVGAGCRITYGDWAASLNGNPPVPADEIGAAAQALGASDAQVVTGSAFTDADIMRRSERGELAQYKVIHFATHGIPATPMPGALCETPLPPSLITSLAPPEEVPPVFPSDGLLSFVEVARLRLDANLVMLSACDTASGVDTVTGRLAGQEESSATLDGLVRAFIVAQARAVIATYWRVPATAGTQDLVETFYRTGRAATIGTALNQAQRSVLGKAPTSHPYFWASFFLVGDGSKSMLAGSTPSGAVTTRVQ